MKLFANADAAGQRIQPPSGGCVLKHRGTDGHALATVPAAFGRLCVETLPTECVEQHLDPAAFGRLCVETPTSDYFAPDNAPSRLRAAVC